MNFKVSKNVKFLFIFFIAIIVSAPLILSFLSNTIENFSNLTPGKYPESETNYLLYDFYPEKKNGELGVTDSQMMYEDYNKYNINSKYLANPNNGSCSPPDFCGPFYNNKKVIIPPQPPIIPFSSPQVRVNFYGSHPLICPQNYYPDQE